ncbi:hypothetical protein EES45_01240 [Streptomyces sp. ADI97-07]|nr:hypothetical protein EES45_01240 [Streptomyces sp. ADI97-07]
MSGLSGVPGARAKGLGGCLPARRMRTCPRTSGPALTGRPGRQDQTRSNRSRFITLSHAATKSFTNFSLASSLA